MDSTFVNPIGKRKDKNVGSIGRLQVGTNGYYTLINFDMQGVIWSVISVRLRINVHTAIPNLQVYELYGVQRM